MCGIGWGSGKGDERPTYCCDNRGLESSWGMVARVGVFPSRQPRTVEISSCYCKLIINKLCPTNVQGFFRRWILHSYTAYPLLLLSLLWQFIIFPVMNRRRTTLAIMNNNRPQKEKKRTLYISCVRCISRN
ncbi:uncharacterized protein LOC143201556 [Rhynchophorus ferrugineus]|uniref:uncharacterized protein LOC143201556 n=1 Tax=Rhynchophorus ferrugineus TaxID=354439 RepID=UPI003FCEBF33